MAANLSDLHPPRGSRHRKVRVGRGIGSKMPQDSGRGQQGTEIAQGIFAPAGL